MANESIEILMRLIDGVTEPLKQIKSHMEETSKIQKRLGKSIQNVGSQISGVGQAMLPMAGAIVGATGLGIRAFKEFDATIVSAGAKANATTEEMEKLRASAISLGAEYPIAASDAARGMEQLAAAGYDANQILGIMPSIITAAVASGEDLALTSDVVSNALNIWNLKQGDIATNASHVADVVQQAANLSSLSIADFALSMQYAGTPAAALNVGIEELSTAMALMKNKGIEASTIGTSLRSTFSRLADPPKEAAEAIELLGLKVADDTGNFIGLKNVIDQMRTSMNGMTNIQREALAQAIAGTNGYSGLLALIDTAPDVYNEMADAMNMADGSSMKQYEIMSKTVKVAIDQLEGSIESFALSMGDIFSTKIIGASKYLSELVDVLNDLSPASKEMIGNIGIGIVAFTASALAIGKATTAVGTAIKFYGELGATLKASATSTKALDVEVRMLKRGYELARESAISASKSTIEAIRSFTLANALGSARAGLTAFAGGLRAIAVAGRAFILSPIGLAIAAVAAAAYVIYNNWSTLGPFFISLWERIQGAAGKAYKTIASAFDNILEAFSPLIKLVNGLVQGFMQGIGPMGQMGAVLRLLGTVIETVLIATITTLASLIASGLTTAIDIATVVVSSFLNVLAGVITFITGVFAGDWSTAWSGIVEIFSSVFGGIEGVANAVLEGVKGAINSVIDGINSISVDIPSWVPGVGGSKFGQLGIQRLYTGTQAWSGGPAMIHDKGAEIVDLPTGTRVYPHDESLNKRYAEGVSAGASAQPNVSVSIGKVEIHNGDDYESAAEKIVRLMYEKMRIEAQNLNRGAI